ACGPGPSRFRYPVAVYRNREGPGPHATRQRRRGDHLGLQAGAQLPPGEVVDLHLDPAEPGHEAVGDVRNPHRPHPPHFWSDRTLRHASPVPYTVIFFHAHPDDEALLTSGTMAKLAAQGHRVVLVVATAGEAGWSSEEFRADGLLGDRRLSELRRSADALGVSRLEVLGYADSGLSSPTAPPPPGRLPRLVDAAIEDAAGRLAQILVAENASVLTSYDAN